MNKDELMRDIPPTTNIIEPLLSDIIQCPRLILLSENNVDGIV